MSNATNAANGNEAVSRPMTKSRKWRADIMKSIMEKAGAHTDAQTVTFYVPLDDTAGLYSTEN